MATAQQNSHVTCKMATVEEADCWLKEKSRDELKHHLLSAVQRPVVFRRCTDSWTEARRWSPAAVSRILGGRETTFKVCPRRKSAEYRERFGKRETVFETQCEHVQATFLEFAEWLETIVDTSSDADKLSPARKDAVQSEPHRKKLRLEQSSSNHLRPHPLLSYPPSQYWIYADYKYMSKLCDDRPELMQAIDWSVLGFSGRGGADSTLWVGSGESHTPCHYDTYGCNLVAQLWGRKKWTLFAPSDSPCLYPTRIPYEESSVFSEVNVACPDVERYPDFASATVYQVILEAGDALFVPRHWWHYVECLEPAVSVNTWIDLPSDSYERVKEAVVRTMVAGWLPDDATDNSENQEQRLWVNPKEEVFSLSENLELLSQMVSEHQAPSSQSRPSTSRPQISHREWVKVLTSDAVVETIANKLTGCQHR